MHQTKNAASEPYIITTKFTPPRLPITLISQFATNQILKDTYTKSLILVTAPAGYGKTTLLAQLKIKQSKLGKKVAWLTLDENDTRLSQFTTYLVDSIKFIGCPIGGAALMAFQKSPPNALEAFRNTLINEIHAYTEPLTIIIDDLHYVKNQQIIYLIDQLINYAPSNLCIVLASRHEPAISIPKYRIHGNMIEISSKDLKFSYEDAHNFIHQTLELSTNDYGLSRQLYEFTGGWAAALQLALIPIKNSDDVDKILVSISGSKIQLKEFLYTDVLSKLPGSLVSFLTKTSILSHLSFDLCAAVTGLPNCDQLLNKLKQLNLFLLPVDGVEAWYTYHPLFRETMRMNLMEYPETKIQVLHRKASEWYEGQNLLADALKHALAGNDNVRALRLLEESAIDALGAGKFQTIIEWHDIVQPPTVEDYPNIWIATAYSYMLCFCLAESRQIMQKIRKTRLINDELIQFRLSVIELTIAMYEDDREEILALYETWPSTLPFQDPLFLPASLNPVSVAFSQIGEFKKAREIYNFSKDMPDDDTGFMAATYRQCYLSHSYFLEGRLQIAEKLCRDRLILSEKRFGYYSVSACASAGFLSELLYEKNQLEEMFAMLSERLIIINENLTPDGIIKPYVSLVKAFQRYAEFEKALSIASELYSIGKKNKQQRFMVNSLSVRILILLEMEDIIGAEETLKQLQEVVTDEKVQSLPANEVYNTVSLAQIHVFLYHKRYEDALQELMTIRDCKVFPKQRCLTVKVNVLICVCHEFLNSGTSVTKQIHDVIKEGQKIGLINTFLEEKLFMECVESALPELLVDKRYNSTKKYVLYLLEQQKSQKEIIINCQSTETPDTQFLTDKEQLILSFVAHGLSNKSIANKLNVSINTIKYHLKKIYTKIDVSNRIEAGIYAQKLDLTNE